MKHLLLLCLAAISMIVQGQIQENIPLYPEGIKNNPISHEKNESFVYKEPLKGALVNENKVYSNISVPTYSIFRPTEARPNGSCVLILPGGGFVDNWYDKEGKDVALHFNKAGITCMVLKYRTNERQGSGFKYPMNEYLPIALSDVNQALLTLKSLQKELQIDTSKIGMIGFSAGAILTGYTVLKTYPSVSTCQPAYVGLIYGTGSLDDLASVNLKLLPPVFIAIARDDQLLPISRSMNFFSKIITEVPRSEMHIYSRGNHGFGNPGASSDMWHASFVAWMKDIGMLP